MSNTTMTPRDVLIAAKALIDTPEKWGKGLHRYPKLCAGDAIEFASGDDDYRPAAYCLEQTSPYLERRGSLFCIVDTNDDSRITHADVMAWFDRAIEAAQ